MLSKTITLFALLVTLAVFSQLSGTTITASPNATASITFTGDVARILYENCAECHRPNDIAPFSVLTYKDVRPWARSIREKVIAREMPPWYADPRYGHFKNDARLSKKDID